MYQNCCKKCGSVSLYTFEHSQTPTPIDWSSVKPLPPVTDAEPFSPMKNGDYMELCDVKTGARYIAKIIDVKN